jgi:hypothetical protein
VYFLLTFDKRGRLMRWIMSRSALVCGLLCVALTGCATSGQGAVEGNGGPTARSPSWNKFFVAGSRIPRELDASGQPLTGSHIVTITDEQLQRSSGVLLGEKLTGGYPR